MASGRDEQQVHPPSPSTAQGEDPSPRATRFANGALWLFAALCLMNLFFAFHLHRRGAMKIVPAVSLAALVALRLRGKPAHRLSAVLTLIPVALTITGFEIFMNLKRPRDGTAAFLRGDPFDSRGLFEVIRDMRKQDPTVQSYAIPRALLTHNLDIPRWADESLARTVHPNWGLVVDGKQTLPFSGVANRTTVFCNESGYWAVYDSDEHGFNNPRGLWDKAPLDVLILGDSYSQGACVPQDKITAAVVRQKFPRTLTLGMCANGPLMHHATLKEFGSDLRPKVVLWVYFNNDLTDLDVEVQSEVLMRYFKEDGFRQNLRDRQAGIDRELNAYLDDVGSRSPLWPDALANVGLTRASTPLFLQDIVMREQHSSVSGVLRLDWISTAISTRVFQPQIYSAPPRWDMFREILVKAKAAAESWGGKLHFVYLPDSYFLEFQGKREDPRRQGVLQAARDAGLPVIDIHERFVKLPNPAGFKPHYEAHYNEDGFRLVGEMMLDWLEKNGS